jgi:hypothetical protein
MLNFYLIKDEMAKPNSFKQTTLELAGSIDEYVFEDLQHKKLIEDRFDYYSDFR